MKLFNILLILLIFTITSQTVAQSREDERRPTRLPVTVVVDKTSADGNWMKVYEIGGGMSDDLITEMFISDESGINTNELYRLDLVEQYQLLFGLSEMVPHELITVVAEQQAKELEMADWELVGTPQLQGEDCLMPGENPPPVWPKDIELPPCPKPDPEPIGKEPLPPEPTPPGNGKPLPEHCKHEYQWFYGIYIGGAIMDYNCVSYQGSIDFQEWTEEAKFGQTIEQGTVELTMGYKKVGGWVYLAKNKQYQAQDGTYIIEFDGPIRKSKVIADPAPEAYYHWYLDVSKAMPLFYPFQELFAYPHVDCLTGKVDELNDDSLFECAPF